MSLTVMMVGKTAENLFGSAARHHIYDNLSTVPPPMPAKLNKTWIFQLRYDKVLSQMLLMTWNLMLNPAEPTLSLPASSIALPLPEATPNAIPPLTVHFMEMCFAVSGHLLLPLHFFGA